MLNNRETAKLAAHLTQELTRCTQGYLYDYEVVCDRSNNSGEMIDQGQMVVDITVPLPGRLYEIAPGWIATTMSGRQIGDLHPFRENAIEAIRHWVLSGSGAGKFVEVFPCMGNAIAFVEHEMREGAVDIEISGAIPKEGSSVASWAVVKYDLPE